ncbi:TPA: hypothetical protein ACH3X3_005150 [Trebouxia sp. C0006]
MAQWCCSGPACGRRKQLLRVLPKGATAVMNGEDVSAAALDANANEIADPNALLSVQSQGQGTS